jgi:(R)-2-hydroxyacyl-CoA dehydratese activating ATPase
MSELSAIGVDVGSTSWKAVVIDSTGTIRESLVMATHPVIDKQTREGLEKLCQMANITKKLPIGATGYGRKKVEATRALTEITCHARGAASLAGKEGTLIDIGGQDTKVIRFAKDGKVEDFAMNDKCAAGTGRFLEVLLNRLQVPYDEVTEMVAQTDRAVPVSSTCTVFAESEVISLVSEGESVPAILNGVHHSLAFRVSSLLGRQGQDRQLFMSGGVALNEAMAAMLTRSLEKSVMVLPQPQLVGALGAALSVL